MPKPGGPKAVLVVVAGLAAVAAIVVVAIFLPRLWAGPAGETQKQTITQTGAYRIQGYEHFYDLQEQIAATDTKLAGYPEALDIRQAQECRGLLATRANLVAAYNTWSRAETTTGRWRAEELPETLPQTTPRTC